MSFDWLKFFEQYQIEWVETGPNARPGKPAIPCPFCGSADHSQHMSISLDGNGWRCWRRPSEHFGKSPIRLVKALLSCSYERAAEIVGSSNNFIPSDFAAQAIGLLQKASVPTIIPKLEIPEEFLPMMPRHGSKPFYAYLEGRGFTGNKLEDFLDLYQPYYARSGLYKGRLILPIYMDCQLITWTGRTIYPSVELRYKTLSSDKEKADAEGLGQAIKPISDCLINYDFLKQTDCDSIYLVEGPMDAAKINVLGNYEGICSTCFFTAAPTSRQIDLLHEILPRFRHRYLMLDQGTMATALRIKSSLSGLQLKIKSLPSGIKDPGCLPDLATLLQCT